MLRLSIVLLAITASGCTGASGDDGGITYPSTLTCNSCDCGLDGGFDLYLGTPPSAPLVTVTAQRDGVTVASFRRGPVENTITLEADAADGGSMTVMSTPPVMLSKALVSGQMSWSLFNLDEVDWVTTGGVFSAVGALKVISHSGTVRDEERPVLAPLSAITAEPDAGVVTVTLDGKTVSAGQGQTVEFDR
ncbi:MAG: hypothetical protein QM723_37610 [Myxococcaceae bacterium]